MATPAKRVIPEFQFSDNQLQRALTEIRYAIHQLQGLDGSSERVLTSADILAGTSALDNGVVEEAPQDSKDYGRKNKAWNHVLGVQGAGADRVFQENEASVDEDYTVTGRNAMSVGLITVNALVTVASGATWVVI
jgi:hypothetical protein